MKEENLREYLQLLKRLGLHEEYLRLVAFLSIKGICPIGIKPLIEEDEQ